MLRVGLLGVFRISGVDNRVWSELGPAGRGLASFMFAYSGQRHRRERLADLFWPNLEAERARGALNSAVWRLRKLLAVQPEGVGQNLQIVGSEMVLNRSPSIDIDVLVLEEAAAIALKQFAAFNGLDTLRHITALLNRYEGPFLDGDDGDWILEERERLHALFVRTATLVVRHLGAAGLYHDAIGLARRALRFDPYREELVRILMILLVLNERRGEAIQYYQTWSRSLKAALDIAPLPTTRKLMDEIRGLQSAEGLEALRACLVGLSRQAADSFP
jgi:DNA-binding SARP family transcriptional activator